MKTDIHPKYVDCVATCACGASFKTRSTREKISVESCSQCHPFYTGKEILLDSTGRVERFRKKYGTARSQKKRSLAEQLAARAKSKDDKKFLAGQEADRTGRKQEKAGAKKAKAEVKPPKAEAKPENGKEQ